MAAQYPADSQIQSLERAVFFDSLDGIFRTSRYKAAGRRSHRRDISPIKINGQQQQTGE